MKNDSNTYVVRSREQIKDELIVAQDKRNTMLGWTGGAFAGELIARDWMANSNQFKSPLIFALSMTALGTILGDVYYSSKVHHLKHELNSSTQLHTPSL